MALPTITYETYLPDKCWILSSSQAAKNFIRSDFDYGARQRRAIRGYDTQKVNILLSASELASWKSFWAAINDGTDTFYTNQYIHQDGTTGKIARFTDTYSVNEINNNMFEVSTNVELILTGI